MYKYILISGALSIAFILGGLCYVNYQLSPEPTRCQKLTTEAGYVSEIANSTGRVPGDVKTHSQEKFSVSKGVCDE